MNWDLGHYERTAPALEPVAELVAAQLAVVPGDVVVDLGCGTGNLAVALVARDVAVVGVDPSPRLLGVARARATQAGLGGIRFVEGRAEQIPLADDSVDAVGSVFGVVFTPSAPAAAHKLARVLRPGGRIVLTAWLREGALAQQAVLRRDLLAGLPGAADNGPAPALFAWHDEPELSELFAPYGFVVSLEEHALPFVGSSPAAYAEEELGSHPLWAGAREQLEPAGRWADARAELIALYALANEDPAAFRVTSRYVVATASAR